jgi:hypothetical protein
MKTLKMGKQLLLVMAAVAIMMTSVISAHAQCTPVGNPAVFGNNIWNVYAWNAGGNFPTVDTWSTNYAGYFSVDVLNFESYLYWYDANSPSYGYTNYQGCPVSFGYHSWSAKRKGFPCGTYSLSVPEHAYSAQLWINGTMLWEHQGYHDGHENVWSGFLGSNDEVEFRATKGPDSGSSAMLIFANFGIHGLTTFCPGYSSPLSAPPGADSYLWSTGETTQSISVNTAGTFSVNASRDGCTIPFSATTVVQPMEAPGVYSYSPGTCVVDNAWLQITYYNSSYNYVWSSGVESYGDPTASVSEAGTYSLTASDALGCSATTSFKVGGLPIGDPSSFGQNEWNVHLWNSGGFVPDANTWNANYAGHFAAAELNLDTYNYWDDWGNPQGSPNGCLVDDENHSWSAKRQGFPCGSYSINILSHDDAAQLWVNEAKVWEDLGCCNGASNVWSGTLSGQDKVEFRATEGGGSSNGSIEFILLSDPVIPASVFTPTGYTLCPNNAPEFMVENPLQGYTYTWGPGLYVWNNYAYGIDTGNFTLTATDANGCSATTPFTITAPPGYSIQPGINEWNVFAYENRTWSPPGYSGYYTETALSFDTRNRWNTDGRPSEASGYQGCNVNTYNFSWSAIRQGFPAGTYTIDINGHSDLYELYIDGVLIATHDGWDDAGHNAVWTGALGSTSTVRLSVRCAPSNEYFESLAPSFGAITFNLSNPVTITSASSPAPHNGYNVRCNSGSDGTAAVSAANGSTPYTYSWSNGQTTATATGLAAGTYTVTVTDASGATATGSVILTAPPALTVNASSTNPLIFYGYSYDQLSPVTASASGGTGTISYSWSMSRNLNCNVANSAGDESMSGGWNTGCACSTSNCSTPAGNYSGTSFSAKLTSDANFTVIVTDANQCTASATMHIDAIDARCFAGNSGTTKVQMCHLTGNASNPYVTMCVSQNAVAEMLGLGDCLGSCSSYSNPLLCAGYRLASEGTTTGETQFEAYPNPFTGITTIAFSVPNDGAAVVRVFDAMGRQAAVLFDDDAKAGVVNKVIFDGSGFPAGIYFYMLAAPGLNETRRMNLVK